MFESGSRWLALGLFPLVAAVSLALAGCERSTAPAELPTESELTTACSGPSDCVSGACKRPDCLVCETVDFDFDREARRVENGAVVESRYPPLSIQVFKDAARTRRGLGVAYDTSVSGRAPHLRFNGQGNALVSQSVFSQQEVAEGRVAVPDDDHHGAHFEFSFPEPVCADSLTLLGISAGERAEVRLFDSRGRELTQPVVRGGGDKQPVALGTRCGVSRLKVKLSAGGALDDLRVCAPGRSPLGLSGPGRQCGVEVIDGASSALDPCVSGTRIARGRLDGHHRRVALPFSLTELSTLCVRVEGDGAKRGSLKLDGRPMAEPEDGDVRQTAETGAHVVVFEAESGGHHASRSDATVEVLAAPGAFDPRNAKSDGCLLVTNLDENPDVFDPPGTTIFSALAQLDTSCPARDHLTLEFAVHVYRPGSCDRVKTLTGSVPATSGQSASLSATWNGTNDDGVELPDGDYLWNTEVRLVQRSHGSRRHSRELAKVKTGFRGIRLFGAVPPEDCRKAVQNRAAALGLVDLNRNFQARREVLRCGADTPTACEIDFFTVVNIQRYEMAERQIRDLVSPAEARAFSVDRDRKVRLADDDPTWLPDFCRGDADRDLVGDRRDRCPGTPAFTATDDFGCTDPTLPPAPTREDMREAFGGIRMAFASGCSASDVPAPTELVKTCIDFAAQTTNIVFRPVKNLPATCPVWYVMRGTALHQTGPNVPARPVSIAFGPLLNPVETPEGMVFALGADSGDLSDPFITGAHVRVTVQTVTGMGRTSQESEVQETTVTSCQ